jgi:hypothetical protein
LSVVVLAPRCLPHEENAGNKPPSSASAQPKPASEKDGKRAKPSKGPASTALDRKRAAMLTNARHDAVLSGPFEDDFERAATGPDWRLTGPGWHLSEGQLCATRARNHPAWLTRKLPVNALVEFDAESHSPDGDIKVEMFGNGAGFAGGISYNDATSYVAIFGGWKNSLHVLARLDEHGEDRKAVELASNGASLRERPVVPDRLYHFRIERRDGKTLSWSVDGEKIHDFADPKPLAGAGHDHFGFNDWEAHVCFDNLRVTPL